MAKIILSDGTNIWYELIGNGPILVLNHGYGSSHKSLQFVADYLKDSFTCLLWDERGQGDSDKPLGKSYKETAKIYTIDRLAEDCHELLQQLNLIDNPKFGKVFMYGHSMGGMISLTYAIKYQNTLKALAIGSTLAKNTDMEKVVQVKMVKMNPSQINQEYFRKDGPKGFTPQFINDHPEFLDLKVSDKLKVPTDVTIALLDNFVTKYNVTKGIKKLKIPVLILHGKKDETIGFKEGEKLQQLIPNSSLIAFEDQCHEINKEIPQIVAEKIEKFFLK